MSQDNQNDLKSGDGDETSDGEAPAPSPLMLSMAAAADLLMAIAIMLLAAFIIIESWSMPVMGPLGMMTSPGFLPLYLGIVAFLLALTLALGSISKNALSGMGPLLSSIAKNDETQRLLVLIAMITGYVIIIPYMHFALANFVFLIVIFSYLKASYWWVNILLAAAVAVTTGYYMPAIFGMPLP